MANHIWTVLCRRAIVDRDANSVSMIDVVEEISFSPKESVSSEKWSGIPLGMTFVSLFSRSDFATPERSRLRIELIAPDGTSFNDAEIPLIEIDLSTHPRARALVNLPAMPHRGFGVHNFEFFMERSNGAWRKVATIPIQVKEIARTEVAEEEPASQKTKPKATKTKA